MKPVAVIPALDRDRETLSHTVACCLEAGLQPFVVLQLTDHPEGEPVPESVIPDYGAEGVWTYVSVGALGKGGAVHTGLRHLRLWNYKFEREYPAFLVVDADLPGLDWRDLWRVAYGATGGRHTRLVYGSAGRVATALNAVLEALSIDHPEDGRFLCSNVQGYPAGHRARLLDTPTGYGWDSGAAMTLWRAGVQSLAIAAGGPRTNAATSGDHVRRVLLDNLDAVLGGDPAWSASVASTLT